jgi:paraquat-inducible protein B
MKRRANPTVIGLFVVGALVLAVLAVVALAGGNVFQRKERAVAYFSGSIYGLQVGAPVVFRGVRLGQVSSIGVAYDKGRDSFSIPVVVEIDQGVMRGRIAREGSTEATDAPTLEALVQRGLTARLAMQSILTGQLYVDLDFRPDKPAERVGLSAGRVEIPTVRTPIQDLQAQIEDLNIRQLIDDVSVIATTTRKFVAGPQLNELMADLQQVAASSKRITALLEQRLDPMLKDARGAIASADRAMRSTDTTMRNADRALAKAGGAIDKVEGAADRVGQSADRLGALASPDQPLLKSLQAGADELARSAAALREAAGDDGATMQRLQRALKEVSQAARSLRDMTDQIEQQPESLLRGRRGQPAGE